MEFSSEKDQEMALRRNKNYVGKLAHCSASQNLLQLPFQNQIISRLVDCFSFYFLLCHYAEVERCIKFRLLS